MSGDVSEFHPTRSTDHLACAGARDLADWLAHLRLKNRADRTLDDYERTIAALLLWRDKPVDEYTLEDLEHFVLFKYGPKPGARVRMSHLKGFFDFLYSRDRIHKNIGARLEMPKKHGQKVIDIFADVELELIYAADPLAEIAKREKQTREREYRKLCEQFPCPDCGADPVELSTDMIEEHRFAPRDSEGFPMLYAPYEMGETRGATYRTTVVCANGHTWFSEPIVKWFEQPFTGPPMLGRR